MTTFSSSSFSFCSTLVLCLIVAFFVTPSTSNPLGKVCIKSKSPIFCLQVFGQNTYNSPYELTQDVLNLTLTNATETIKKIHTFMNRTEDKNLKDIYNYCLNFYQSTIDTLRSAKENYLKGGQYVYVINAGIAAEVNAFRCENEFQSKWGYSYDSTLTKDNKNLSIFSSIVVSAADLLFNSTLVKIIMHI